EDAELYHRRGRAQGWLGRWPEALADCARAVDLGSASAAAWHTRSRAHFRLGHDAEALADLGRALERAPDHGAFWLSKYRACAAQGQGDEAERAYARALQGAPAVALPADRTWARRERRAGLAQRLDWEEAADDFSAALAAGQTDAWLWRGRGLA